jgi:hypothetical protein
MIVMVIGSVGLFLSYEFFLKIIYGSIFLFLGAFILILYDFLRLSYWSYYSHVAEFLTKNQALRLYDACTFKVKSPFIKEAPLPYTYILQIAIKCQLLKITNDTNGYWLSRYAMKIVLKTGG